MLIKFLVHTHTSHNKKKDKNHYSSRNNSLLLPQEMPPTTPKGPARSCSLTAACGHCPVAARAWQVLPTGTLRDSGFMIPSCFPGGTWTFHREHVRSCFLRYLFGGRSEKNINSREKLKITEFIKSPALGGSHKNHRDHLQALHGTSPRIPPQTHF